MGRCAPHACGAIRGQKRALDPLELELDRCELPCLCWELNLGPWHIESVFLMAESTLWLIHNF